MSEEWPILMIDWCNGKCMSVLKYPHISKETILFFSENAEDKDNEQTGKNFNL